MNLHIEKLYLPEIDSRIERIARAIQNKADQHDGTVTELPLDYSLNRRQGIAPLLLANTQGKYVGYLSVFQPLEGTAELTAAVRPEYRKTHIFTRLIQTLRKSYASETGSIMNIPKFLYVCNRNSLEGKGVLTHFGMTVNHTEYLMQLDLHIYQSGMFRRKKETLIRKAELQDTEDLVRLFTQTFHESEAEARSYVNGALTNLARTQLIMFHKTTPAGLGSYIHEQGYTSIYGLGILPEYRGRGLGRTLLNSIIQEALRHTRPIRLEVDSTNELALKLYQSCGFRSVSIYDYYGNV
ncbi:MAG: N-acetyltransferase [Spirochaetales bacterium]|jgi:ribosomal protein S18 acetylase RimI-like enzyme|nr:N-acetyltransferase [Spirochaetales bacterium]